MSILIKGMEMPTSCADCRFYGATYCYAKGDEDAHSTLSCPLISIPPHGDLIDRNGLDMTDFEISTCVLDKGNPFKNGLEYLLKKIEDAPTIIEAEENVDG